MTEKETFMAFLKEQGFTISKPDFLMGRLDFGAPHHRISEIGTHTIITSIHVVDFGGCDVKKGDLGCVCYYYLGTQRRKHCKTIETQAEILKRVECPTIASSAIKIFKQWRQETAAAIKSWKVVL